MSIVFVATFIYNAGMDKQNKPKSVGRPKASNPASVTIPRVRVTPDKLEAYKAAAERSGQTFSAWAREWLNKGAQE